jgi:Na+/melibiose symporter-like transporter
VSPRAFLLYGCGQLGVMALTRFFYQWVLTFAGQKPEGSDEPLFAAASVGALFFAFRIFDGLTDPLAGVATDAWVARGRERRSLLWLSFLLAPLGLVLVFAPDAGMSIGMRWAVLTLGMFVFFVGYTLYVIPYWSLVDDYSGGDVPRRARLSNVLGVGVLVATGFGFVLSPVMVSRLGYLSAAMIWCLPCGALMVLPYFARPPGARPDGARTAAPGAAAPRAAPARGALLAGFRLAFSDRRFQAIIVLFAGGQMSFTVMTAAAPFIATELLGGSHVDVAKLLGPFLLTAVLGFAIVPRLAARHGWQRAVLVATVLLGVTYGGSGLLGFSLVSSPLVTAMLVFAAAGPMASVLLGLEGEAIASSAAAQEGEVTSVYFGVYNFVVKSLNGLAVFLTGILIDAIPALGSLAVRGMGFLAGGLLIAGVLLYLVLRPRASPQPRPA